MNSDRKWWLERINDYPIILSDIEQLKRKLNQSSYKVTASYGLTGGGGSGHNNSSKVEAFAIRHAQLEAELREKEALITLLDRAIDNAGMTQRERELILCMMGGYTLSSYARQKNIYKSHVYKIRDAALKKIVRYITEIQNDVCNRVKS